jgi:uncharacterized damage-inducible protein DinB
MSLSQSLLPEFDQEMKSTRRTLERVPSGKSSWQPHPKSMTLGRLATHIAEMPSWTTMTAHTDELDLGAMPYDPLTLGSAEEIVALFDKNVAEAREALLGVSDEELMKPWTFRMGDHVIFTLPKIAVLRGMVMNHVIHHRGQLTVYLRLNDVPVPGLYGPSADEGNF